MDLMFWENWTLGQGLFYGGLTLLGLTAVLVVVFALRRPAYRPGDTAGPQAAAGTAPLRSGYPTQRQTRRAASAAPKGTEAMPTPLPAGGTQLMTAPIPAGGTQLMEENEQDK